MAVFEFLDFAGLWKKWDAAVDIGDDFSCFYIGK